MDASSVHVLFFFFLSAYTGGSCSLAEHYLPFGIFTLHSVLRLNGHVSVGPVCLTWITIEHWESKLTTYGHQGITI